MSTMGSKLLWVAGGAALFTAAFVGVGLARGVPLRDVASLAWLAGRKPSGDAGHASAASAPVAAEPAAPASKAAIVPPLTAGVLGAFVMPSPYDARELHDLEKSLKDGLASVAAEEERQKRRERELDDWQSVLQQRAQELSALRKAIDEASPLEGGDKISSAKSAASWRSLSPLFEEGDASDVAVRLAELEPDQAAQVLRGLDSDRCAELLNALPKERYKAYLDAWRRAGG
jgi:flagellar motility protein MotE (MotC chaperone)